VAFCRMRSLTVEKVTSEADSGGDPPRMSGWAIAPGVPKLRHDASAGGMHGVCDQAPSAHLIRAPQSGVSHSQSRQPLIAVASATISPAEARWA